MRRSYWTGFLILMLAIAVASSCGGGDDDAPRLVVIDQNILHGIGDEDPEDAPFDRIEERIELLAEGLKEAQPDIVFFQEVLTAGEDYPDIRQIVLDALGDGYTAVFGNLVGDEIDTPGLGQMTFTRLPVLSTENFHIQSARAVHRVTVQTEDGPLDLFNVHLDGTSFEDPQTSVDEITKVMDFIEDTRSGPVILAGDFNAEPDEPSIEALRAAGYIDVLAEVGDSTCDEEGDPGCTNSTIPLGDPGRRSDQRIDYVFVLPGDEVRLEPGEAELFLHDAIDIGGGQFLWASDHIGVRAVLKLKR